jgi:hypothetical protein
MSSNNGLTIITMPSIAQNNPKTDHLPAFSGLPCGLFMEVGLDGKTGVLKPTFHRIILNDNLGHDFQTREVDFNHMRSFSRNKKPPIAQSHRA